MARAYGSNATLLLKRETAYGQAAAGDYTCVRPAGGPSVTAPCAASTAGPSPPARRRSARREITAVAENDAVHTADLAA